MLPGHAAAPFVDYAAEVAALGPVERRRVMGKASYALVESGAVEWRDVVTRTRIRPFAEVVERAGLTERALVQAGVAPRQARQAWEAIRGPEGAALAPRSRPRAGVPDVLPPREPAAAPPPARTPIGAKLAAWTEGDAKIKALQALDDETTLRLRGAATRTRARLDAAVQALKAAGPDDLAALRQLKDLAEGDLEAAEGRLARVLRDQRRAAQAALGVPEAGRFGWEHAITGKGWDLAEQQRLAAAFVEPLVRAGGGSVVQSRIEWKSTPKTGRSNYRNQQIRMTPGREEAVAIHEWGHAIENQVPGVRTAAREFLAHRVGDEAPRTLADLFPNQKYEPDETGRRDHFDDHFEGDRAYYVGKVYADGSTEVVSMGLEALYRDPARFAREDPELCKFILGTLSGDLR